MRARYFIFTLLLVSLIGCASNNAELRLDDEVDSMERVGNYDGLVEYYKNKIEISPNDTASMQELAKVYFDKGDIESARFYSDYLLGLNMVNWELSQLRGQVYHADQEDVLAVEFYQHSIELGNKTAEVNVLLGISNCMLGHYELAERYFNNARIKGYNDAAIKNNLALVKFADGRYQDVVDLLLPLYFSDPKNKKVQANLAIALIKLGYVEQASDILGSRYSINEVTTMSKRLSSGAGSSI
ncbi:tetratricopeptide repeat protein [Vibrio sp. 10N.261.46.E12]|uniref:tetratricopeptide repeat protein n=1 Tax=unclassified Vibrio TaxID=2614977 RepID=UPI000975AEE5|nr:MULTISPECIES: hypothetical protein [unclassified Vibrio]OMO36807.1 hypothetical protein BH584_02770 [Vibrio sp. 10N.261.45.E1]PMJ28148.1 hypothetical protein BCU27_05430 [Vibrio sp. 10N.286.45.B6]PML89084.1 hypothetical protein BCT66_08760 [Vibrio sp. 10N.261.49.E11]PMM71010.1 hypothetical protein BCT48_08635 [Vibrio sp. 10N.261.46.F12]PMM90049.1 hypothetical protein BCT46_03925 [Vibrio sp. 10N.261.46.E8]